MIIKTKISFKEYRNLLFRITYKKPVMKFILFVALAMVVWIAGYYTHILPVPKPQIYQYITLTLIVLVQPVSIYLTIKQNYDSSNHLGEPLEIELTHKNIKVRGETFYTEVLWKSIFKVVEKRDWFLIYLNNLSAVIIPKRNFSDKQIEELKAILSTIRNVPMKIETNKL